MVIELSPIIVIMLQALPAILAIAGCTWLVSLYLNKISIIYYSWPVVLMLPALVYLTEVQTLGTAQIALVTMVCCWALRLSLFAIKRGRHQPEDRRYRALRERSSKSFRWQSFYLLVVVQPLLAWAVSSVFAIALSADMQWSLYHSAGVVVWLFGFSFETVADNQLYRFNRLVVNEQQTLTTGLWRYCRHPNYFGEFCVWWGWFIFAAPAGNGFVVLAPLIVTWLLLKLSGISLMESGITQRRRDYQGYMQSTNTFLPWPPREQVKGELYE
jgi:steroid 5-alpha reductase family enzyme